MCVSLKNPFEGVILLKFTVYMYSIAEILELLPINQFFFSFVPKLKSCGEMALSL